MNRLERSDIRDLLRDRSSPCVSIFLPVPTPGPESASVATRLRHFVSDCERSLVERGLRAVEARQWLEPARSLADAPPTTWTGDDSPGLAIFISGDGHREFAVDAPIEAFAVVGPRFSVRPLLPLLTDAGRFAVLAIERGGARLFAGNRHELEEVPLRESPADLAEMRRFDDPQKQYQYHPRTPSGGGRRQAVYFGHGGAKDTEAEPVRAYLRALDEGLARSLHQPDVPIVLAGNEDLAARFRNVTGRRTIVDGHIAGAIETLEPRTLLPIAWELARASVARRHDEAAARYRNQAGTGETSTDIGEIAAAARTGRVETLFVDTSRPIWGSFDPTTGSVSVDEKAEPDNEDLLDLAVAWTLRTDGVAYAETRGAVPGGGAVAAILR